MRRTLAFISCVLIALSIVPAASGQEGLRSTVVLRADATVTGQPIQFPALRNQLTGVLAEMAPGGQTGMHYHPFPLVVYVIEGTLRVEIEGHDPKVYIAGQAYAEAVNHPHNAINAGTAPARFLIVLAGVTGTAGLIGLPGSRPVGFRTSVVLQTTRTASNQPLFFPLWRNQFLVGLVELAPGGQTGRHKHPNPVLAYVLDGAVTMEEDGQRLRVLETGQGLVESVDTWLNHLNRSSSPSRMLVVFFVEEGVPLSIR